MQVIKIKPKILSNTHNSIMAADKPTIAIIPILPVMSQVSLHSSTDGASIDKPKPKKIVVKKITPQIDVSAQSFNPDQMTTATTAIAEPSKTTPSPKIATPSKTTPSTTTPSIATPSKATPSKTAAKIPINQELIDLLTNKHDFDLKNENKTIIDQFNLLVIQIQHQIACLTDKKEKQKHGFRLQHIQKAINIFEDFPGKIVSGTQAQKINGIGKGIGNRIDEILKTGTLIELTDRQFVTDYTQSIQDLMTITGIGQSRAKELVDDFKVTSVADLMDKYAQGIIKVAKNQLTHHMAVGMKYYDDFKKKIPRSETIAIDMQILQPTAKILDKDLIVQVCGSFRRERDFSGDIDVLITHTGLLTETDVKVCQRKYLIEYVNLLMANGFLIDSLTDRGQTKYMGVCYLAGLSQYCHRIDIRFVPYDCFSPAVLYFTGSWHFNKIFRGIANDRGYTVNEYGIFHYHNREKGDKIPVFSEQDIFNIVGIKYLEPWQREL